MTPLDALRRGALTGARELRLDRCGLSDLPREVFDLADQVVVLDFGRVIACGPPREVRTDARVQRAYFGNIAALEAENADA